MENMKMKSYYQMCPVQGFSQAQLDVVFKSLDMVRDYFNDKLPIPTSKEEVEQLEETQEWKDRERYKDLLDKAYKMANPMLEAETQMKAWEQLLDCQKAFEEARKIAVDEFPWMNFSMSLSLDGVQFELKTFHEILDWH